MVKHGDRPKGKKMRLYGIWQHMRERCNNPNHKQYRSYGGRGITVCKEWEDYCAFRKWAYENGYQDTLTLDRENNDLGYSPDNCRWATWKEQGNNRRSNRILELNGEAHNIQAWCEITGLPRTVVDGRLGRGWSVEKTLTTPLLTKGGKVREPRNSLDAKNHGRAV